MVICGTKNGYSVATLEESIEAPLLLIVYMDYIIREDLKTIYFLLVFKISADLFLMSVSWFIFVARSIHRNSMKLQKAHPKMMGV